MPRLPLRGLWREPDFLRLWAGQTVSRLGSEVSLLALPFAAALTLKANALEMGILNALGYAPFLLLGLLVGVWVDRLRRRPIMITADLSRAALLATVPLAALLGRLTIGQLFVVAFLVGSSTVFFDVAYQSYLPSLVTRSALPEANSKLEASRSVAQTVGPGIAGILVQILSAPVAISLDAISFLVSALSLLLIRGPELVEAPGDPRRSLWSEMREGLAVVLGDGVLRSIAGCTATWNFFAGLFEALYVLYAVRHLGITAGVLGLIFMVGGPGGLAGALAAVPLTRRLGIRRAMLGAVLADGLGNVLVPLASQALVVPLLVIARASDGFAVMVYKINQVSLRQAITPHRLQGRMNATMRFIVWGTIPIGSLAGGGLAQLIGLRAALLIGALGVLLASGWIVLGPIRQVDDSPFLPEGH